MKWYRCTPGLQLYDMAGFKAGGISLDALERGEVGDVAGKSLLHLQCHFGMDTLSWARLGAQVTGMDYSPEAIAKAQQLAAECGLEARFICCNLYDLPRAARRAIRYRLYFVRRAVLAARPARMGTHRRLLR